MPSEEQQEQQQPQERSSFESWLKELGRRHVFRVLAIYVAVGWGFTEIVQGVVEQVGAPQSISSFVTIAFIVGFPIVVFLAWMFDVDRHGVHRAPTRGKGQLVVSLAVAVLLSASYGIYRYLPRDEQPARYEPPDDIVMAVLPFKNLSAGEEFEYLGQAIAEDLLNGVAVLPEIRVKATFSSFSLAGEEPAAFDEKLGVNRLLDGTFRVQDGNLRLSTRMIDTATGDVVWSRVLTDSISNIFQVQDQVAKDIAAELGVPHPADTRKSSRKVDPRVYELYLQARKGMVNPWMDTEATMQKLRQILELEPNFPEALMFMGFLQTGFAWTMEDRQSPFLQAGEEYTLRALELDPGMSEGYAALALNYALQYRWMEARQMADKAIEVAGSRPLTVVYTFPYNNLGHKSKSQDILLRIFAEDPLNYRAVQNLMAVYVDTGQDDRALQVEKMLIDRGQRYQRHYLIEVYARKGDMDTARQLAGLWGQEHGFDAEEAPKIFAAWINNDGEQFEAATDELVASGKLPMGQAIWNYMAAGTDPDKIFDWAVEAIPNGKFNQITLIVPRAAPYRQDPRWLEIYTELGLVDYWKTVELPDFCATESIAGLCE